MKATLGFWLLAGWAILRLLDGVSFAASAESDGLDRQWAVLIAVEKHATPRFDLSFTTADALSLRNVLVERAGMPKDQVLVMTDESGDKLRPTLENLRREVPKFLARIPAGDRVIVFYSGHGEVFDQETYLIPRDFQLAKPTTTALPARELREALNECRAKIKFLILDCCHAGGTKAPVQFGLPSETFAKNIVREPIADCVVLASCKAEEQSREWTERRQGVFTYWLCRALEGGADTNGDGVLTADEVYEYTHQRVSQTVHDVFDRLQTPVRMIGGTIDGVPTVLSLLPERPETLNRRLAEHLDLEIRRHKLKGIGVLEFAEPRGRSEGLTAASLPKYCAEQIRAALAAVGRNAYAVLSDEQLRGKTSDLPVEDLGDPTAMRGVLKDKLNGLDALVWGTLKRRGQRINVQCELIDTQSGETLASPTGVMPLSVGLLVDNGASADVHQQPVSVPYAAAEVARVQQQAHEPHPQLKPDFPFRLEVWTIQVQPGEPITAQTPRRRKEFTTLPAEPGQPGRDQSELLIGASQGEEFELRVWNKTPNPVALRLLLDGLNSLEQRRERVETAAYWLVRPTGESGPPCVISGWYLRDSAASNGYTVKRFKFVDLAAGVATRQKFGESIGIITAAFYQEGGRGEPASTGRLAIGEGQQARQELKHTPFRLGPFAAAVQIRYVREAELEKLLAD